MTIPQKMTFQAIFEMGRLFVIDRSADLPALPDQMPLFWYLNQLTHDQWRVDSMSFEGFTLTEKMDHSDAANQDAPHYMIQFLADHMAKDITSHPLNDQKSAVENFSETVNKLGWKELATSKPLADLSGGIWIISIWMK